jgi:hypothetical protein
MTGAIGVLRNTSVNGSAANDHTALIDEEG